MVEIVKTAEFDRWLKDLKDTRARAKVIIRIQRLGLGNAGDVAPVGNGISEMRIHYGPGYRVYYKQQGATVTLLFGGDKATQEADIQKAKALSE